MKWFILAALILGIAIVVIVNRYGSEDYGSGAFVGTTIAFILGFLLIFGALVTFVVLLFNAI